MPKIKLRFNLIVLGFLIFFVLFWFGVFTHLFEKDLGELKNSFYPSLQLINIKNSNELLDVDINKHYYKYLYNLNQTCDDSAGRTPYLLMLVKSKFSNFHERLAIRETWGNQNYYKDQLVKVIFLLGIPSIDEPKVIYNANEYFDIQDNKFENSNLNVFDMIMLENRIYNDIVQQTFHDTYYNNTLKAIMGLRWIEKYCSNSKYYLFIDDDQFLNPHLLFKYLKTYIDPNQELYENFYAGFVYEHEPPIRSRLSKWYLSLNEYPFNEFPPFIPAGFYLLSASTADLFNKATKIIPKFRFDDIYMAIVAYLLNIKPLHIKNTYNKLYYNKIVEEHSHEVVVVHGVSPEVLRKTWKKIQ